MTLNSLTTDKPAALGFQIELEFGNVGFVEGGKPENPEKNPRSKDENQQQTQPTYDVKFGNRTRATFVGGNCSHHCVIPPPHKGVLIGSVTMNGNVHHVSLTEKEPLPNFFGKAVERLVLA